LVDFAKFCENQWNFRQLREATTLSTAEQKGLFLARTRLDLSINAQLEVQNFRKKPEIPSQRKEIPKSLLEKENTDSLDCSSKSELFGHLKNICEPLEQQIHCSKALLRNNSRFRTFAGSQNLPLGKKNLHITDCKPSRTPILSK